MRRQSWPGELPLIATEVNPNVTAGDLDIPVIMYSCSFAVIMLMILAQVDCCREREKIIYCDTLHGVLRGY